MPATYSFHALCQCMCSQPAALLSPPAALSRNPRSVDVVVAVDGSPTACADGRYTAMRRVLSQPKSDRCGTRHSPCSNFHGRKRDYNTLHSRDQNDVSLAAACLPLRQHQAFFCELEPKACRKIWKICCSCSGKVKYSSPSDSKTTKLKLTMCKYE